MFKKMSEARCMEFARVLERDGHESPLDAVSRRPGAVPQFKPAEGLQEAWNYQHSEKGKLWVVTYLRDNWTSVSLYSDRERNWVGSTLVEGSGGDYSEVLQLGAEYYYNMVKEDEAAQRARERKG